MNDLLQHPLLLLLLIVLPIVVVGFSVIAEQLGIDIDLKRGRSNLRTLLFWLSLGAVAFALVFFLEL